jgi:hypothetical protein
MERDHYAYELRDGTIDFETFENELEKREKPADQLIKKMRNFKVLTPGEKMRFAEYMTMMYKRVPKRQAEAHKSWPKFFKEESDRIYQEIDEARVEAVIQGDNQMVRRINLLRPIVDSHLRSFEAGIPEEFRLRTMLSDMPQVRTALASMTWQYFRPPIGQFFITSDSPMFRFDSLGLNRKNSEFTFPVSSYIAIVGSWHDVAETFIDATSEAVDEINRRAAMSASKFVYAKIVDRRIYDLMNDSESGNYLFYGPLP